MKFVNITYGLKGQSKQYTYLVNDNVKVGQVVFPSFRHYPDGKITATVGVVQTTNSVTSKDGINMAKMMNEQGIVPNYIATSLNKPTDIMRENGKFVSGTGIAKTELNDENLYASTTPENYDNVKNSNKVLSTQSVNKELAREQSPSVKNGNTNIEINARNGKERYETAQEYFDRYYPKK